MRKLVLSASILAVSAVAASAADLAPQTYYTKAPPPAPVAAYNWTGFYIGGSLGGDWIQNDNATLSLPAGPPQAFQPFLANGSIPTNYGTNGSGLIYGGQAGYNWQMSNFVVGLEADFSGTTENNTQTVITDVPAAGVSLGLAYSTKIDALGTVRGRIGVLATPSLLLYATGGFAYGEVSHSYSESFGAPGTTPTINQSFGSVSNWDTGWTVGAGAEYALDQNWSIKGEYLFVNLSGDTFTTTATSGCGIPGACAFTLSPSHLGLNIARLGVNYKFGGPVVAKY